MRIAVLLIISAGEIPQAAATVRLVFCDEPRILTAVSTSL